MRLPIGPASASSSSGKWLATKPAPLWETRVAKLCVLMNSCSFAESVSANEEGTYMVESPTSSRVIAGSGRGGGRPVVEQLLQPGDDLIRDFDSHEVAAGNKMRSPFGRDRVISQAIAGETMLSASPCQSVTALVDR